MNARIILTVLTAALLLSGCASVSTEPGTRFALMAPRPFGGTTAQFLTICNPNPDVGPVTCNVVLTGHTADAEAWLFEARIRVVSNVGIPYGREPVDYVIVGGQAHCETVRRLLRSKPHPFYDEETPPTEPCQGPLYFKPESVPGTETR